MTNMAPEPVQKGTKLTAAQKRARAAAKKGGYVDRNLDGIPDSDQLDFSVLGDQWAWVSNLIQDDEEIAGIFKNAADNRFWETPQGIENFKNDIRQSGWWQNSNTFFRDAYKMERTDPGTFQEVLKDSRFRVQEIASELGINLNPSELDDFARKYVYEGWGKRPDGERQFIRQIADRLEYGTTPGGRRGLRGQAGNTEEQLRQIARLNRLQLDDNYFLGATRGILSGLTTIEEQERDLREMSAQRWPAFADKIRSGFDLEGLASPYLSILQEELGVPATAGFNHPYVTEAMSNGMNLWDFYLKVRNDPKWVDTPKGQNEVASAAVGVMKMFGLVG